MIYRPDPLVADFTRLAVVGTSKRVGTTARAERLRASGAEFVIDAGTWNGSAPAGVDCVVVMTGPGGAVSDDLQKALTLSGMFWLVQDYASEPSYCAEYERLLASDADLLSELEKLLPDDNPIRQQRQVLREQLGLPV